MIRQRNFLFRVIFTVWQIVFVLLILVANSVWGQQAAKRPEAVRFDFRGGIARLRRPLTNQAFFIKNARLMADGTLTVRGGQTLHTTVGSASVGSIQGVFSYYTTETGLGVHSIKREDGVNDKWYLGSTLLTGVDFGTGAHSSFAQYKDIIFASNGATDITYHTPGTGTIAFITGDPVPPKGQHILFYFDRCYVGDSVGKVSWSNAGMFSTLPTCDFPALNFQILGSIGNPINALVAGQDFLIAFTSTSYHIMTGVPDDDGGVGDMKWQNFMTVGVLHPKNVTVSGRDTLFFGADRRIYSLSGAGLTDLDENNLIQEYLTSVDISVLDAVSLFHLGDELWMYVPKAGNRADGRILVRNPAGSWTTFEDIDGFVFAQEAALNKLFVGSAEGGYIWEQDSGDTDLGTKIAFELVGRQESLGILRKRKKFRICSVQSGIAPGDTLTISYSLDNSGQFTNLGTSSVTAILWGAELWTTSVWGAQNTETDFFHFNQLGREIQIKVTGSVPGGTRFLGYHVEGNTVERDY